MSTHTTVRIHTTWRFNTAIRTIGCSVLSPFPTTGCQREHPVQRRLLFRHATPNFGYPRAVDRADAPARVASASSFLRRYPGAPTFPKAPGSDRLDRGGSAT